MKSFLRGFNVLIGCLLVAISINFFLIPNNLVSFGFDGLATLIYYGNHVRPEINLLIMNVIVLLFASLFIPKERILSYLYPSLLIPIFMFATSLFMTKISLNIPEMMLTVIVAGFLSGYGYSMIYKEGYQAGVTFLIEELVGKFLHFPSKIYSWVIDIIILGILLLVFNYEIMLYSLLVIIINKYIITKVRFGINDSKMFYVITAKDKEVKNYIMHDLKYELTVLDVKGGFTKKKNQILLTVISTNDYYKLKEGIKIIDPNAFIAITDTYDVVNRKSF